MPVDYQRLQPNADPTALAARAVSLLDAGELVVLPTETVYGAAGRLDCPAAVAKLKALRRDATGPFTIHLASPDDVDAIVGELSPLGRRMTQKLWPGPVAIVFDVAAPQRAALAKRLKLKEADLFHDGTITLRCPDHLMSTAILGEVDGPTAIARVETNFSDQPFDEKSLAALDAAGVSLIIDAGRTRFAKPSTIVRVEGEKYRVIREGVFDERIIKRQLETMILFVCSGNTCRSPMASALATRILRERYGIKDKMDLDAAGIRVASAGTFAMPGLRATPQAVDALANLGVDLSSHRSQQLSQELIHAADFIFTMGRSHTDSAIAMSPSAAARVIQLDPARDVEDPIGHDVSTYRELADQFVPLIESRFEETVFKLHPPKSSQQSASQSSSGSEAKK